MRKEKSKALLAEGRTTWIKPYTSSREHKLFIFEAFVLGCPIPHVSGAGKMFAPLSRRDNNLSQRYLERFLGDISEGQVYSSFDSRQVAKKLVEDKRDGCSIPNGGHEFACFTKSPAGVLKDAYSLYPDIERDALRAKEYGPYESLLELDALFRHLRNSFAHGLFAEVQRKSFISGKREAFFYCQDNSPHKQISARMFLSFARLKKIAEMVAENAQ